MNIRPQKFGDFVGQANVVERLRIAAVAAKQRRDPMNHVLLLGPPGTGKTSLAMLLANEMHTSVKILSAPLVKRSDLFPVLRSLRDGEILFLDEIHRLAPAVEEILYPAMEDFRLDLRVGARVVALSLQQFMLVGATTRPGSISQPLRQRFPISLALNFYSPIELGQIVARSARILRIEIDSDACVEIGKRSRGIARNANSLLLHIRDAAQLRGCKITRQLVDEVCTRDGVDALGLDASDRALLRTVAEAGRPVGANTLAAILNDEVTNVEEMREPFLLRAGLLGRTNRGRIALPAAFKHLGINRFAVHVF